MKRTSLALVCLLIAAASTSSFATITEDINPLDARLADTSGTTVIVTVTNTSDAAQKGTVTAEVDRGGRTYRASARTTVGAGSSATLRIILGTITDDINPLDIRLGAVVDDPDPLG